MKRTSLLTGLLVVLALLAGCGAEEATPETPTLLPVPDVATSDGSAGGDVASDATLNVPQLATTTTDAAATEPPTSEPPPTEPVQPSPVPTTQAPPTAEMPTAAVAPTEQPTLTSEPPPTAAPTMPSVSIFGPGQMATAALAAGGSGSYLINGVRFQPVILFVEPSETLDIALDAYSGDQTGRLPEGGSPKATTDNALAGRPELLVLSPDVDGLHTFIIRAMSGEGTYNAHLYDLTTPASGMAVQQPDALAAGETKSYAVSSRGWRPVVVMARPTDGSDIAIDVLGSDGAFLTTSNYSGPGSLETAYVLPLGTTTYTVNVREVNGSASSYEVAIVTME